MTKLPPFDEAMLLEGYRYADSAGHYPQVWYKDGEDPAMIASIAAHAAAAEIVTDGDRDWFIANPGRVYRVRPISEAELAFHKHEKHEPLPSGVIVRQIKPGVRVRLTIDACEFPCSENYSDDVCEELFDKFAKDYPEQNESIKKFTSPDFRSPKNTT